ncbi:unnamed protein product, partial [Menidia menidia]
QLIGHKQWAKGRGRAGSCAVQEEWKIKVAQGEEERGEGTTERRRAWKSGEEKESCKEPEKRSKEESGGAPRLSKSTVCRIEFTIQMHFQKKSVCIRAGAQSRRYPVHSHVSQLPRFLIPTDNSALVSYLRPALISQSPRPDPD